MNNEKRSSEYFMSRKLCRETKSGLVFSISDVYRKHKKGYERVNWRLTDCYPFDGIPLIGIIKLNKDNILNINSVINNWCIESQLKFIISEKEALVAMYVYYDSNQNDRCVFYYIINTVTGKLIKEKKYLSRNELIVHLKSLILGSNKSTNIKEDEY